MFIGRSRFSDLVCLDSSTFREFGLRLMIPDSPVRSAVVVEHALTEGSCHPAFPSAEKAASASKMQFSVLLSPSKEVMQHSQQPRNDEVHEVLEDRRGIFEAKRHFGPAELAERTTKCGDVSRVLGQPFSQSKVEKNT